MQTPAFWAMLIWFCAIGQAIPATAETLNLSSLDLSHMTVGWGKVQPNKSIDGKPLTIAGQTFDSGIGAHAPSALAIDLHASCDRFTASVGVDDEVTSKPGSVEFIVYIDNQPRWKSGIMRPGDRAKSIDLDLKNARKLRLVATDAGDGSSYDHADWANATLSFTGPKPAAEPLASTLLISTAHSALAFQLAPDSPLRQLYFGPAPHPTNAPKDLPEAYPAAGDAYLFEPALRAVHADGNTSIDLQCISSTSKKLDDNITLTRIDLKDPAYPFFVTLCFKAYQAEDVIEQWTEIRHEEPSAVTLYNFASSALALPAKDCYLTQFHGDYSDEMNPTEEKLTSGIKIIDSKLGARAHYYRNPSFLLSLSGPAQENSGQVIGGTLAWSGSFQLAFEVDPTGRLHALCGINPFASQYNLPPAQTFTTPAMIWTSSSTGAGQVARNFHRWARKYALRDGDRPRPILLNNWEATFFDFDEKKIVSLFDGAREIGLDLFLLDDGWFGNKHPRNSDNAGLGDWQPNARKLPHGVSYLATEAKKRNLRFGIWLEPEMVNPASDLFEKHPDWAIRQPKREPNLFRNQLILDLSRPEVREFAFHVVDDLLTQNPGVSYIKWDANRYITQPGSTYLPAANQSHLWIDYNRALYDIMERLARKHPSVEMMLCSGGGGRVDYGALRYFHEFWPSDNTDPLRRVFIQWGYSQFFPAIATSNHVTRMGNRPIKLAFDVAMSGRLGMDVDLAKYSAEEKRFAASAIATYKSFRDVVLFGEPYRLEPPYDRDRAALSYVTPDRSRAILFVYQLRNAQTVPPVILQGLDPNRPYRLRELNLPAGAVSQLSLNNQVVPGATLMRDGLVPPCSKTCQSTVVELLAEPAADGQGKTFGQ